MKITRLYLIVILVFIGLLASAQNTYKVSLFRAAPGKLTELIDLLKVNSENYKNTAGEKPFIIRHSQGDHWDLMVIEFINNQSEYYSTNGELSKIFTPEYGNEFYDLIAFHENLVVTGSNYDLVSDILESNNYFHVEMFVALAGKQKELLNQRIMENDYLAKIDRPENLIFTTVEGASWDIFTLGGYRDIKHFAKSADISFEVEEKAAIAAGFKGVSDISPYLRSLILKHNDTLANKVQ